MNSKPQQQWVRTQRLDQKDLYTSLVQHLANVEQVSWNRFNNYLMSNSIFVLGWATIYAASPPPPHARFILTSVCAIGFLSAIVWTGLGYRSRKNVETILQLGRRFEETFSSPELHDLGPFRNLLDLRDTVPLACTGSFRVLTLGPPVFGIMCIILFFASLSR